MMKILLLLFTCCIFGTLFAQTPAEAELDAANTEAYLAMMDADKLLESGDKAKALALYEKSLTAYEALRKTHPAYKETIVSYRLATLREKIRELGGSRPSAEPGTAAAPAHPPAVPAPDDYEALYLETREKMARDAARLLEVEKRNIEMSLALRDQQEQLEELRSALRGAHSELQTAKRETTQQTAGLEKETRDLARFNQLLQERLDQMESARESLSGQREAFRKEAEDLTARLQSLEAEHEAVKRELAETKLGAGQSEQRLILARNQLRDDLTVAEENLVTAQTKVAELEEKLKQIPLLEERILALNQRDGALQSAMKEREAELERLRGEQGVLSARNAILEKEQEAHLRLTEELKTAQAAMAGELKTAQAAQAAAEEAVASRAREFERMARDLERSQQAQARAEEKFKAAEQEQWARREAVKNLEKEGERLGAVAEEQRKLAAAETARVAEAQARMQEMSERIAKLREEGDAARTRLEEETRLLQETRANLDARDAAFQEISADRDRLQLNLRQEREAREALRETANQQLKALSERMNEITRLRRQLAGVAEELNTASPPGE